MYADQEIIGTNFWKKWVVASAIGLVAGFVIFFPLVVDLAAELDLIVGIPIAAGAGAILGALIGVAQSVVLRKSALQPDRWVLASAAGGAFGGVFALLIGDSVGDATNFYGALASGGAILGATIGLGQWFMLRHELSKAGWWVLASVIGLAVSLSFGPLIGRAVNDGIEAIVGESLARLVAIAIFGFFFTVYGAITGMTLRRLWQQPRPGVNKRNRVAVNQ